MPEVIVLLVAAADGEGSAMYKLLSSAGLVVRGLLPAPAEVHPLEAALRTAADAPAVRCVFTVGAAGTGRGDCAPEALSAVCTRLLPGVPEAVRAVLPPVEAALFRGQAGLRGHALVINLPAGYALRALRALLPAVAAFARGAAV